MSSTRLSMMTQAIPRGSNSHGMSFSSVSKTTDRGSVALFRSRLSFAQAAASCIGKWPSLRRRMSGPESVIVPSLSRMITSFSLPMSTSFDTTRDTSSPKPSLEGNEVRSVTLPFSVSVILACAAKSLEKLVEKPAIEMPQAIPMPLLKDSRE